MLIVALGLLQIVGYLTKVKAIRAGIDSLPDAVRANGQDFQIQMEEIKESNKILDKLDLKLDTDPRADHQRLGKSEEEQTSGGNGNGDDDDGTE